jgi:hypothetical protein
MGFQQVLFMIGRNTRADVCFFGVFFFYLGTGSMALGHGLGMYSVGNVAIFCFILHLTKNNGTYGLGKI